MEGVLMSEDTQQNTVDTIVTVAQNSLKWIVGWLKGYILIILFAGLFSVGMLEWIGVKTGIPRAVVPYIIYLSIAIIPGSILGKITLDLIQKYRGTFLHILNTASGHTGGELLPPQRWDNLTVEAPSGVDNDGDIVWEEVDRDELYQITTKKYGKSYECLNYDSDTNTARVSWMAGSSPREIRAFKKELRRVKTTLSILADLGLEESMNRTPIVRTITEKLARYMVMCHQKGTIPNGDEIQSVVSDVMSNQMGADWTTIEEKMQTRLPDDHQMAEHGSDFVIGGEEDE
jgi:hypothetical protein